MLTFLIAIAIIVSETHAAQPPIKVSACASHLGEKDKEQGKLPHVVVVEDEDFQRETLTEFLRQEGYRVSGVASGSAFRQLVAKDPPSLALIDLHLPGSEDGFSLLRFLRERSRQVGIIVVTASSDSNNQVVGLEMGADDYVSKPYNARLLLARIKAVFRRSGPPEKMGQDLRVRIGKTILDLESRRLYTMSGEEIPLRTNEFDLLKLFVENPNRPLRRAWILDVLSHGHSDAFDRAVDIRVLRLRRKVEVDPNNPQVIRTERQVGYKFVPSD